jgi:hypothetical protein
VALTWATDYQVLLQEASDRHTPGAVGTLTLLVGLFAFTI